MGFNLVAMALQNLNSHASDSARCVAARITESPFGELILYGTVLPGNADPRARKGESLQTFADELEQQKLDWLRISRDFPTATLVVAGDFNQDLAARHYYGSASKRQRLGQVLDHPVLIGHGVDGAAR